jgi:dolichol-phosphate mannosyltransferase
MADHRDSLSARTLVIVPTYNESQTISEVARRLFEVCGDDAELLVIDDASEDGTPHIVRELSRAGDAVHLMERPEKLGLGTAYVAGFEWGIERGYWAMVEMDADLSHDPADVPKLVRALNDADLVVGSRYVPGGSIENWGRLRRWLSAAGNVYARAWLGYGVKDSTSGFRAYRTEWLDDQDLDDVKSEGYAFQIEMTRRVHRSGGRIVEVPITFTERLHGKSKLSRRIVLEALVGVARWGAYDRLRGRPETRRLKSMRSR